MNKIISINDVAKKFLQEKLLVAIKELKFHKINEILDILNRKLYDSEKKQMIEIAANHQEKAFYQLTTIQFTGLHEFLTKKIVLDYVKVGYSFDSEIQDLKISTDWIEAIILCFIKKGELDKATKYTIIVHRKLTRDEVVECLKNFIKRNKECKEKEFQKFVQRLGSKNVPKVHLKTFREKARQKARRENDYETFKRMGGFKKDFGDHRFEKHLLGYTNSGRQKALEFIMTEKLFHLKALPDVLDNITDGGFFDNDSFIRASKQFIKRAPRRVGRQYVSLLIQKKSFTSLSHIGVHIDNFVIRQFITYLKCELQSGNGKRQFDMDSVVREFPRKPNKYEIGILLEHIAAQRTDFQEVFNLAKKYEYPITAKLVRALEKKE